ncbi:Basic leucine zipper and W2 domain-containing protein 1, partial [Fragariocoptes setiger]
EEFKKIIVFLKGFEPADRVKLAKLTAVLLSQAFLPANVLLSAIQDHLVKDSLALDFLVQVLKTWVDEKDSTTVWNQLRKGSVDSKLLEFLPPNKRSSENIVQTFQNNGLSQLVVFQKAKETEAKKYELQKQIGNMINKNTPIKEVIEFVKDVKRKNGLDEAESAVLVWKTLMSLVEWNKKEELLADQALKHLRTYSPLVAAFTTSAKAELSLIIKIQEYCYDNMNFLKAFQKIIALFYKADVLSEDAILKWYREAHLPKGKSIFLPEMKVFVEWLESAEEESGAEEE